MEKVLNWFKKPQVWGFFLSMAVIAIISIAFFYPDNFEGNSLMQSDMHQGSANGQEAHLYQTATGEKALWTNSLMSGMPTFQIAPAYPSNSLFKWIDKVYGLWLPSPSNLLFMMMFGFFILLYCMKMRWWYALIGAVAWGFSSYFVIIIGAGHLWKFIALSYIPPTIGGLVLCYRHRYVLGGALVALFAMMQLNANHPQMTYYFLFVMVALALAYLFVALKEKTLKQWVIASVVAICAGALAVGANLPSLYNTYEYTKETKRSQSELSPLPSETEEAVAPKERPTGGLPKSEIVYWSYGGSESFSLLIPNIKGGASAKPEKGQMVPLSLSDLDSASDAPRDVAPLLPYFSQYFNDSEGTNGPVYVGAIICALFLLGCIIVRGPIKWTLIVLTVLSLLLALGRNFSSLTDFMIYNFPLYSKFRAVESILVIAEFTIPLLAIMALAKYMRAERDKKYEAKDEKDDLIGLYITFGICAFVCLLGALVPSAFGNAITQQDKDMVAQILQAYPDYGFTANRIYDTLTAMRHGMLRADAWRSLFLLAIAFSFLWLYKKKNFSAVATVAIVGVAVLFDLYSVDKRYISHDSFAPVSRTYDSFAPDAIDQQILQDQGLSYRVMDIPGFGSPTRSYHHKMIGGYHAAKLNRYEDLIQRRMKYITNTGQIAKMIGAGPADVLQLAMLPDSVLSEYPEQLVDIISEVSADLRVLDMLNAKYIITGDQNAPVIINSSALGNAWLVDTISYVDNADAEMAALSTLNPGKEAVADKKFQSVLGDAVKAADTDNIALTSYTPNTLKYDVNTANGGLAVFSEVYFPWGWHATIDGAPAQLGRVNYVLRALKVPAGKHEVVMTFDPQSLHVTGNIAYACVTIIYLWLILAMLIVYMRRNKAKQ